jgi:hypothetical protein
MFRSFSQKRRSRELKPATPAPSSLHTHPYLKTRSCASSLHTHPYLKTRSVALIPQTGNAGALIPSHSPLPTARSGASSLTSSEAATSLTRLPERSEQEEQVGHGHKAIVVEVGGACIRIRATEVVRS